MIIIFIYSSEISLKNQVFFNSRWLSSNNRTYDFRLYPQSRSDLEYHRIQINNIVQPIFLYYENQTDKTINYSEPLEYSPSIFRLASFPIIWVDDQGDLRWNRAAQYEMLNYLLEKQFPNDNISTCLSRPLFILAEWESGGIFSRFHAFIEHFGVTLYSSSMTLPSLTRFGSPDSAKEDFLNEGNYRYFQSISLCSLYINNPELKILRNRIQSMRYDTLGIEYMENADQFLDRNESTVKYKYSKHPWTFRYDHVPHRRWLFDRNRKEIKKNLTYYSPIELLINHSNEHIYSHINTSPNWTPRNCPKGYQHRVLNGTTTTFKNEDHIFCSFLQYMFLLFFSPFAPRIQAISKLLANHWSEYLSDKFNQPYNDTLSKMAVIYIRRGDKMYEDSFWSKHKRWRNISMYVKGIINEEKRRQINYTTIFVMTDDVSVMNSIQEYARDGLTETNQDEPYARQHLYGRSILYNVFAPQACIDRFGRIDFDQFLVNIQFIREYASLVIGHRDSNVARYMEEIIYVNRQHEENIQTRTYVINAPDSLD